MDFTSIGFIGAYTRSMKLAMNWKQRQDTGDFTSKKENTSSELETYMSQLEQLQKENNPAKQAIYSKLYNGKKLTAEEMEYLRQNDPAAYQKAKEVEMEKARYERDLKKCRTKEEVERLKTAYIGEKMARVNSISGSAVIPKDQKMGLLMQENAKVNAAAEVERAFKKSLAYKQLETDAERAERLRKKREGIPEWVDESEKDERPEKDEKPEKSEKPNEPPKPDEAEAPAEALEPDGAQKPADTQKTVVPDNSKAVTFDTYMSHKEAAKPVPYERYGRIMYGGTNISADKTAVSTIKRRKI